MYITDPTHTLEQFGVIGHLKSLVRALDRFHFSVVTPASAGIGADTAAKQEDCGRACTCPGQCRRVDLACLLNEGPEFELEGLSMGFTRLPANPQQLGRVNQ